MWEALGAALLLALLFGHGCSHPELHPRDNQRFDFSKSNCDPAQRTVLEQSFGDAIRLAKGIKDDKTTKFAEDYAFLDLFGPLVHSTVHGSTILGVFSDIVTTTWTIRPTCEPDSSDACSKPFSYGELEN
jgi:hypothetical protein